MSGFTHGNRLIEFAGIFCYKLGSRDMKNKEQLLKGIAEIAFIRHKNMFDFHMRVG
jgi:hypothetical protein